MTRALLLVILLAVIPPSLARETVYSLGPDLWMTPRDASLVLSRPELSAAVRDWAQAPSAARLVIRYPGGEEGSLWAAELKHWLVGLGVPSAAIDVLPGSSQPDHIELIVNHQEDMPQ